MQKASSDRGSSFKDTWFLAHLLIRWVFSIRLRQVCPGTELIKVDATFRESRSQATLTLGSSSLAFNASPRTDRGPRQDSREECLAARLNDTTPASFQSLNNLFSQCRKIGSLRAADDVFLKFSSLVLPKSEGSRIILFIDDATASSETTVRISSASTTLQATL